MKSNFIQTYLRGTKELQVYSQMNKYFLILNEPLYWCSSSLFLKKTIMGKVFLSNLKVRKLHIKHLDLKSDKDKRQQIYQMSYERNIHSHYKMFLS